MINATIEATDLLRQLESLKRTEARKAIRKGSRAAAKVVQAEAKKTAPKRTGTLSRNIKVRALPRSRRYVGTTVKEVSDHAGFTEFGTKYVKGDHNIEKAFQAKKDDATSVFLTTIKQEIEGMK